MTIAPFYRRTVETLLRDQTLDRAARTLVVGGGETDRSVLVACGFTDVTITNLDIETPKIDHGIRWARQDAEALTYSDRTFDQVIVHDALHHCASPHRALTEMYRVSRRTVLAFEPRDTLLHRMAEKVGLGAPYEVEAVADNSMTAGGYRGGPIPNFVYRWTRREVSKTLATYDPTGVVPVRFFQGMRLPAQRAMMQNSLWRRSALLGAGMVARVLAALAPGQGNLFAFCVQRPASRFPWLDEHGLTDQWAQDRIQAISPRRLNSDSMDEMAARASASTVPPPVGASIVGSVGVNAR